MNQNPPNRRKMDFSKIFSGESSECSSRSGYTSGTNDSTSTSSMTDGSSTTTTTTTTTTSQQSMDCDYSTTCTSTTCHRHQQYDRRGRPIGVVSSPLALFFSCMAVPCLAAPPPPPGSRGADESASSASSVTSSIVAQARHKSARKARANSQRYNRPTSPAWLSRHVANAYYEEKKRLNTPYNFNRN